MSKSSDGIIDGTIINELGIKIFDFTFRKKKMYILNVISPLNKWYIRKVLKKDFYYILSNIENTDKINKREKKRITIQINDGEITAINHRYKINYIFTPIKKDNEIYQ